MRIAALHLSPGHNYFGHHGREPGAHAIAEVDAVECLAGRGLRGAGRAILAITTRRALLQGECAQRQHWGLLPLSGIRRHLSHRETIRPGDERGAGLGLAAPMRV